MNSKKRTAFSMFETMLTIIILGILFAIAALNVKSIMADDNVSKFKKANGILESTVASLINNNSFYGDYLGFKNTDLVILDKVGERFEGVSKFRDCFKHTVNITEDEIPCTLYKGTSSSGCFRTEEGVVWGIPDSDFVNSNTIIEIEDFDGYKIDALPITIYLDYQENQSVKYNAIVAAVTFDGKVSFLKDDKMDNSPNCTKEKAAVCNLKKYIQATTIQAKDND